MTSKEAATKELAAARTEREDLESAMEANKQRESDAIAEAFRAGLHPSEIEQAVGRKPSHVRARRPLDVPPLRTGGNAKLGRSAVAKKAGQGKPPKKS